jgi:high-affinity iron transporter
MLFRRFCPVAVVLAALFSLPARADETGASVQGAWRLLDYIAVDYGGAVKQGEILSDAEFSEQKEFAARAAAKIAALPAGPEQLHLIAAASHLQRAVADKVAAPEVAKLAHGLADALLAAYPVSLAPIKTPDLRRGAQLYAERCASCHGAAGDGHGPAAAALKTAPIAFDDLERARQRSVFALFQVISLGIEGTAMQSFSDLPPADRWALALYAAQFAFTPRTASEGERLWKTDSALRAALPDLTALMSLTPAALEERVGVSKADEALAYLRRHPEVLAAQAAGSLSWVHQRLAESVAAARAGHRAEAGSLALSAYLDGFEAIEPTLGARDRALMEHIERAMGEYRAAVDRGEPADALAQRVQVIEALLTDAETALASNAGGAVSTFLGAATILLREGLEALLIVVAMIAFLRKAERLEVMPYVHAGWIGALLAGLLTWGVATWAIGISGASRELTEGVGSVFAALVLLSVGIWMHGKAQADQWQRYIREKLSKALSARSAWLLFGLAFIVVYREVFETILFYVALWSQGNGAAMLLGASAACVALGGIAWAMLRYSRQLPIGQFFTYSSWLMAFLTVVLAGKGVAALQEAGSVRIDPLAALPRIPLIGLFPTLQTLAAQSLMILALIIGFQWNRQRASHLAEASR